MIALRTANFTKKKPRVPEVFAFMRSAISTAASISRRSYLNGSTQI